MSKNINFKKPAKQTSSEWIKSGAIESTGSENINYKRLTINLPSNLHTSLKVICAQKGEKMSDVITKMVKKFIEKHA